MIEFRVAAMKPIPNIVRVGILSELSSLYRVDMNYPMENVELKHTKDNTEGDT